MWIKQNVFKFHRHVHFNIMNLFQKLPFHFSVQLYKKHPWACITFTRKLNQKNEWMSLLVQILCLADIIYQEFVLIVSHTQRHIEMKYLQFSSVQLLSCVRLLQPHESQHARPPCPSPTPGVYSNSCPSSQWCRPAIPSSVGSFSSCLQSLPASGSFPMNQLFAWGGQSTGVSALASVVPVNIS